MRPDKSAAVLRLDFEVAFVTCQITMVGAVLTLTALHILPRRHSDILYEADICLEPAFCVAIARFTSFGRITNAL